MPDRPGTGALLTGLLIGLLVGGFLGGFLTPTAPTVAPDDSRPSLSYGRSGPSCYDSPRDHRGWIHVVANGETWLVTLNVTIVHPPGTRVDLTVSERPMGDYEIAFRTGAATADVPSPDQGCQLATAYDLATALEQPDLVVTVDGRTVRTVEQEETVANLYPLPNPLNAST